MSNSTQVILKQVHYTLEWILWQQPWGELDWNCTNCRTAEQNFWHARNPIVQPTSLIFQAINQASWPPHQTAWQMIWQKFSPNLKLVGMTKSWLKLPLPAQCVSGFIGLSWLKRAAWLWLCFSPNVTTGYKRWSPESGLKCVWIYLVQSVPATSHHNRQCKHSVSTLSMQWLIITSSWGM